MVTPLGQGDVRLGTEHVDLVLAPGCSTASLFVGAADFGGSKHDLSMH